MRSLIDIAKGLTILADEKDDLLALLTGLAVAEEHLKDISTTAWTSHNASIGRKADKGLEALGVDYDPFKTS